MDRKEWFSWMNTHLHPHRPWHRSHHPDLLSVSRTSHLLSPTLLLLRTLSSFLADVPMLLGWAVDARHEMYERERRTAAWSKLRLKCNVERVVWWCLSLQQRCHGRSTYMRLQGSYLRVTFQTLSPEFNSNFGCFIGIIYYLLAINISPDSNSDRCPKTTAAESTASSPQPQPHPHPVPLVSRLAKHSNHHWRRHSALCRSSLRLWPERLSPSRWSHLIPSTT